MHRSRYSIAFVLTSLLPVLAIAHPGGLDANGGHVDHRTGQYHVHKAISKANEEEIVGSASVIDGDTIEIRGTRIRLFGIDAPESRQLCTRNGKPWMCGKDAAMALSDYIGRRTVHCQPKAMDRYGRTVAVCRVGDTEINAWMVSQGWALAYLQYGGQAYLPEERQARKARRGIWNSEFEPPWDWRRERGAPGQH
jgi:endonuclease YncB( thermonuclease family)